MHLNDIEALAGSAHEAWRSRLFRLNIRHAEQLGSLLAAPEGPHVLERLEVPIEDVQNALKPVLRNSLGLSLDDRLRPLGQTRSPLWTNDRHPMGHIKGARDPLSEIAFDAELPDAPHDASSSDGAEGHGLPEEVLLGRPRSLSAWDQGRRGTCVAFAVMAMYQLMHVRNKRGPVRLSAQYLYYRAKLECPHGVDEEGTSLGTALQVLRRHGCCLEHQLEYSPQHDLPHAYRVEGHKPNMRQSTLERLASAQRIRGFRELPHSVAAIKAELAQRRPVGVGVGVYQLAWYNMLARLRGEIALPPMAFGPQSTTILDTYLGGHAITLVGYRDNSKEPEDSHRPGGGYFIFRNSWGQDWAPQGPARGYGYLPYDYVRRFCQEAAVIDDLEPPQRDRTTKPSRMPGGSAAAKKPKRPAKNRSKGPRNT